MKKKYSSRSLTIIITIIAVLLGCQQQPPTQTFVIAGSPRPMPSIIPTPETMPSISPSVITIPSAPPSLPPQHENATIDTSLYPDDIKQIQGAVLARKIRALSDASLALVGLVRDDVPSILLNLPGIYVARKKYGARNGLFPFIDPVIIREGPKVFVDISEEARQRFAGLPYSYDDFVRALQAGITDYGVMTSRSGVIVTESASANIRVTLPQWYYAGPPPGTPEPTLSFDPQLDYYYRPSTDSIIISESTSPPTILSDLPWQVKSAISLHYVRLQVCSALARRVAFQWLSINLSEFSIINSYPLSSFQLITRVATNSVNVDEIDFGVVSGTRYLGHSLFPQSNVDIAGKIERALYLVSQGGR